MGLGICLLLQFGLKVRAEQSPFWESFYEQRPQLSTNLRSPQRNPSALKIQNRTIFPLQNHIRMVRRMEWFTLEPYPLVLSGPMYRFRNEWVFSPHPLQNETLIDVGRLLRDQDFLWMP